MLNFKETRRAFINTDFKKFYNILMFYTYISDPTNLGMYLLNINIWNIETYAICVPLPFYGVLSMCVLYLGSTFLIFLSSYYRTLSCSTVVFSIVSVIQIFVIIY